MKRAFVLAHPQARALALECVRTAQDGYVVTVGEPNRSLEQNAAQWPILQAFAVQLQWPVNGRMVRMSPDEWKDVLTAAFRKEQARLAMGLTELIAISDLVDRLDASNRTTPVLPLKHAKPNQ